MSTASRYLDAYADYLEAQDRDNRAAALARRNTEHRGPHKPRCPQCRLTIRGPNHAEGWDHLHRTKVSGDR